MGFFDAVGLSVPFGYVPIVGGFDADAQAFFTQYSITDATEKDAINQFVLDLKGGVGSLTPNSTNIWSIALGIYTYSQTSIAASVGNLKTPLTHDLIHINSPTFATTGITYNGTTQYSKTGIIPSSHLTLNSVTISTYVKNNVDSGGRSLSSRISNTQQLELLPRSSNVASADIYNTSTGRVSGASTDSSSLMTATRRSATDAEIWRKAVSLGTTANGGGTQPTVEIYLMARNASGSPIGMLANELRGGGVLDGSLTTNGNADWDDAWNRYQTNVIAGGRQV